MPYTYKEPLLANTGPILLTVIIDNSETLTLGDAVAIVTGNAELLDSATAAFSGFVHDIVDSKGLSVFGSIATLGSATVASGDTVTVAGNNETVDLIAVMIDVSKLSIYSALVTGTMNTTVNSNKPGAWVNSATTGDRVTESSATRTIATAGHLKAWGADPDDSTRMLVSISESDIFDPGTGAALTSP